MTEEIPGVPEGYRLARIDRAGKCDVYVAGEGRVAVWQSDNPSQSFFAIVEKIPPPWTSKGTPLEHFKPGCWLYMHGGEYYITRSEPKLLHGQLWSQTGIASTILTPAMAHVMGVDLPVPETRATAMWKIS